MAIGFAFTEAGDLGEDLRNFPCNLIRLLGLSLEKVWIEGPRQSGFEIEGLFLQDLESLRICLLSYHLRVFSMGKSKTRCESQKGDDPQEFT